MWQLCFIIISLISNIIIALLAVWDDLVWQKICAQQDATASSVHFKSKIQHIIA